MSELLEQTNSNLNQNMQAKVDYLMKQKLCLEVEIAELKLNNQLLRKVNLSISEGLSDTSLEKLIQRNQSLQSLIEFQSNQQKKMNDQIFIANQIKLQQEQELRQIVSNYESKILELRKSIQQKEVVLQKFQQQYKLQSQIEEVKVPPFSISMHFHTEFQEYQNINNQLKEKNKKLSKQNQKLQQQNLKQQKQVKYLRKITSSKTLFLEHRFFKDRANSCEKSCNKQSQVGKKQDESMNEITRNSLYQNNYQSNWLKMLLKAKFIEAKELKNKLFDCQTKTKELSKLTKILVESNKSYQNSRKQLVNKSKINKQEACTLKNILLNRQTFHQRTLSLDKNTANHQQSLFNMKNQENRKQGIISKSNMRDQFQDFRKFSNSIEGCRITGKKTMKKSLSSFLDYVYQEETQKQDQISLFESEGDQSFSIIGGCKQFSSKQIKNMKKKRSLQQGGEGMFLEIF